MRERERERERARARERERERERERARARAKDTQTHAYIQGELAATAVLCEIVEWRRKDVGKQLHSKVTHTVALDPYSDVRLKIKKRRKKS